MVAIQNSSHTLTPETTLRDIIKTIPSEYFEKKPLRAWLSVLFSLTTAALGYASIALSPWYLLPFAWIFTGTALTGWFVIGHDCGHRSFSNKIWIFFKVFNNKLITLNNKKIKDRQREKFLMSKISFFED